MGWGKGLQNSVRLLTENPEGIHIFLKFVSRKWNLNNIKKRSAAVLTDRPVETALRELENSEHRLK
jgi:hypothetical protein